MIKDQLYNPQFSNLLNIFDTLYDKSKNNKSFSSLMDIIVSRENIFLACKNLENSFISPGIDKKSYNFIKGLPIEELEKKIISKANNFISKPLLICRCPSANKRIRILGNPCILDRLFQQCIKQVLDPICEAKFYEHSYGFRPNRTASDAIARTYFITQRIGLSYCLNVNIIDFISSVNHKKFAKQLWNFGIHDKRLISIIKSMLKAPLVHNGQTIVPEKGVISAGILAPMFTNIILHDLDIWISSQWENFKTRKDYSRLRNKGKTQYVDKSNKYTELKRTSTLKEAYIVRFGDEFKIFCRNYTAAQKFYHAIIEWLDIRLNLKVDMASSGITNLKQSYMEFIGFKIKLKKKSQKWVVQSHLTENTIERIKQDLVSIIKDLKVSSSKKSFYEKVNQYNATVIGVHNFYKIATDISLDLQKLGFEIERIIYNRLSSRYLITREGNLDSKNPIFKRYSKSKQVRFINDRPLLPIAYVKTSPPMSKSQDKTIYSEMGRQRLLKNSNYIYITTLKQLMSSTIFTTEMEYHDNRISAFCKQKGLCFVTGKPLTYNELHCHHLIPRRNGGSDDLQNLVVVSNEVHALIHSTTDEAITSRISIIENEQQLKKLNKLRRICGLEYIETTL